MLLCNTKLAQSTSQYFFVLQSVHHALLSTTLYYKACAKHFLVLLWTTQLVQSTSQYFFVIQSLHKAPPSTTLYHKACTKYFNDPNRNAATRYTEKHTVSCSGFLPNTSPMQHSCCHCNAFCSTTHTFMQPLQCYSHPRVAEHQGRTDYALKRSKPQPPHTGGALHRRLQPLHTEKHTVSCSGFLSSTSPIQLSCCQCNAFCSTTHTFMQPLQCYSHPRVAEHQGRTDYALKRSKPQPPHTGGALHRRLQPLHTEKHTVSCSGFLPSTSPMQHSCSHYHAAIKMRFAAPRTHPCSHYNAIRIPALQNTKGEPITR